MKLLLIILIPLVCLDASVRLSVPFSVQRLDNGNTLIVDGGGQVNLFVSKIIEVNQRGSLVWAYIKGDLGNAHHAEKLTNGNILIADTRNHRAIETDLDGNIIWSYSLGTGYPNDANRLSDNNTLITDRNNSRVIEVTPTGTIVWSYTTGLYWPRDADRLTNGNTLKLRSP